MELSPLIVDVVVVVVLLMSAAPALYSGFLREALRLVDVIFAVVGGLLLYAVAAPYIEQHVVPLDDMIFRIGALIACGVAAFIVGMIITALLSRLFSELHDTVLNRLLGLAFGVVRGLLIVVIVYLGYERIYAGAEDSNCPRQASAEDAGGLRDAIETAYTAQLYCPAADALASAAPESWDDLPESLRELMRPITSIFEGDDAANDPQREAEEIDALDGDALPSNGLGQPSTEFQ